MVAVIKCGKRIRNPLQYNENKLLEGKAQFLHAMNYAKDISKLNFKDKLALLHKHTSSNDKVKVNSVHVSLNFHPSEQLSERKLIDIADDYMRQIGFGDQPYLVYRHFDAAHPHIHIVTTNIKLDGARIPLHGIGREKSEAARKNIERDFQLVAAEGQKDQYRLKAVNTTTLTYGKMETKRAITTVLDAVVPIYKYASLAELNAVLKLYNVVADRGGEDSRVFKSGGLVYRVLDEKGEKVGVPIKASDFYSKPTLNFLKKKFEKNQEAKALLKSQLKKRLDAVFSSTTLSSMEAMMRQLRRQKIQMVLRQNGEGRIYGVTYVDLDKKCVFNGSDLGKGYSAQGVQQYIVSKEANGDAVNESIRATPITSQATIDINEHNGLPDSSSGGLLDVVYNGAIDPELLKEQKKKKRRRRLRL